MKHIASRSLMTVIIIGALAVSCSKDTQNEYAGNGGNSVLQISDLDVHPLGDKLTFSYMSGSDWYIIVNPSDAEWISYQKTGDKNAAKVCIDVEPCVEWPSEYRQAEVVFMSGGRKLDSFKVTQHKLVLDVYEDHSVLDWRKEADRGVIMVTSNVMWDKKLDDDKNFKGFEVADSCGTLEFNVPRTQQLTFSSKDYNFGENPHAATLVITPKKGTTTFAEYQKEVEIVQNNLIFNIYDQTGRQELTSTSTYLHGFSEFGAENQNNYASELIGRNEVYSKTIMVKLEAPYSWTCDLGTLSSDVLSVVQGESTSKKEKERDVNVSLVTITWNKANNSRTTTSSVLNFRLKDVDNVSETQKQISVSQDGYVMDVDGSYSINEVFENKGGSTKLKLNTSGPWEIAGNIPQWMTITPKYGFGQETITVNVDKQNLDFSLKEYAKDAISIRSLLGNGLSVPLNLKQEAFRFDVKFSSGKDSEMVSRMDTDERTIKVTSDGPWTLEMDSPADGEWLLFPGIETIKEDGKVKFVGEACENRSIAVCAQEYKTLSTSSSDDRAKSLKFSSNLHVDNGWGSSGNHIRNLKFTQESLRTDVLKSEGSTEKYVLPSKFVAYSNNDIKTDFYVKCSAPWEIKVVDPDNGSQAVDWVRFTQKYGDGRYETVSMTVDKNKAKKSRKAKFTLSVKVDGQSIDALSGSFVQDAFKFSVDARDVPASFSAWNEKTAAVSVEITDGATFTIDPENSSNWIDIKSSGKNAFTIKPQHNWSLDQTRQTVVNVISDFTQEAYPITIKQDKYEFSVEPSSQTVSFDEIAASAQPQKVDIKCSGEWSITKPDWIKVTDGINEISKGKGNKSIYLTAKTDNPSTNSRSYSVDISSVGHTKTLKGSQNAYTWKVTGMESIPSELNPLENKYNLTVQSSGEWMSTFNKGGDFATLSPSGGSNSKIAPTSATLTISPNYSKQERYVELTINSKAWVSGNSSSDLFKKLNVKQKGYAFSADKTSVELDAAKGSKQTVAVTCTGSELSVDTGAGKDWLKATVDGKNIVLETLSANDGKEREAVVTVTSEHSQGHSDLKVEIKVIQKGK